MNKLLEQSGIFLTLQKSFNTFLDLSRYDAIEFKRFLKASNAYFLEGETQTQNANVALHEQSPNDPALRYLTATASFVRSKNVQNLSEKLKFLSSSGKKTNAGDFSHPHLESFCAKTYTRLGANASGYKNKKTIFSLDLRNLLPFFGREFTLQNLTFFYSSLCDAEKLKNVHLQLNKFRANLRRECGAHISQLQRSTVNKNTKSEIQFALKQIKISQIPVNIKRFSEFCVKKINKIYKKTRSELRNAKVDYKIATANAESYEQVASLFLDALSLKNIGKKEKKKQKKKKIPYNLFPISLVLKSSRQARNKTKDQLHKIEFNYYVRAVMADKNLSFFDASVKALVAKKVSENEARLIMLDSTRIDNSQTMIQVLRATAELFFKKLRDKDEAKQSRGVRDENNRDNSESNRQDYSGQNFETEQQLRTIAKPLIRNQMTQNLNVLEFINRIFGSHTSFFSSQNKLARTYRKLLVLLLELGMFYSCIQSLVRMHPKSDENKFVYENLISNYNTAVEHVREVSTALLDACGEVELYILEKTKNEYNPKTFGSAQHYESVKTFLFFLEKFSESEIKFNELLPNACEQADYFAFLHKNGKVFASKIFNYEKVVRTSRKACSHIRAGLSRCFCLFESNTPRYNFERVLQKGLFAALSTVEFGEISIERVKDMNKMLGGRMPMDSEKLISSYLDEFFVGRYPLQKKQTDTADFELFFRKVSQLAANTNARRKHGASIGRLAFANKYGKTLAPIDHKRLRLVRGEQTLQETIPRKITTTIAGQRSVLRNV